MELTDIIVCPYLTEKTYAKRTEKNKKYAFIVNIKANKHDIAVAFEAIFNVAPIAVKTMIRKQVATRTGTIHPGFTKAFKIAYITLPKDKDIALSNEDLKAKQKTAGNQKQASSSIKPEQGSSVINIKEVSSDSKKKVSSSNAEISKEKQETITNHKQSYASNKSVNDSDVVNIKEKEVTGDSTTFASSVSTNIEKKVSSSNTEISDKKTSLSKQTNKESLER